MKEMKIREKHFNYQKSQGTEQNNKRKEIDVLLLSQKKNIPISSKEKLSKSVELIKVVLSFLYVVCHRCLCGRAIVIFYQNKYILEIPKFLVRNLKNMKYLFSQCQNS